MNPRNLFESASLRRDWYGAASDSQLLMIESDHEFVVN